MILFSNPICYSVHFDGKLGEFRPLIFRVVIKRHALLPVFLKIFASVWGFLNIPLFSECYNRAKNFPL